MINPIWSYLLDGFGLIGLYFTAKAKKIGFLFGVFSMFLWLIYAISTKQYGFIPGCAIYSIIYIKGYKTWTRLEQGGDPRNDDVV